MPKITKSFSLNAHLFKAWLDIMEAASAEKIHIRLIQALSAQPILGLPPKAYKKADHPSSDGLVLNIHANACKVRYVDLENGTLQLDIRIEGMPCPDIVIPIEAIIEIYAPDIPFLSSFGAGLPFSTNMAKVRYIGGQVCVFPSNGLHVDGVMYNQPPQDDQEDNVSGPPANPEPKTSPPKRGHLSIVK